MDKYDRVMRKTYNFYDNPKIIVEAVISIIEDFENYLAFNKEATAVKNLSKSTLLENKTREALKSGLIRLSLVCQYLNW